MAANLTSGCSFFLKRKNRYCKMIPGNGKKFCGEHSYLCAEDEGLSSRKRIPCPLDTNHTVFEDQLQKHLKKCNVTKKRQVEYYQANVNSGQQSDRDHKFTKLPLRKIPKADIEECISLVKSYFKDNVEKINTSVLTDKNLEDEIHKGNANATLLKHLHQQSSLVGNLREANLLTADNIFIEFGAGRGLLSHWVQKSVKDKSNVDFLLVDRASARYKADSYHRGVDQGPSFHRVQIDIEHLHLKKVPLLSSCDEPRGITGISKHLCGAATDLALRCLLCATGTYNGQTNVKSDTTSVDNTSNDERVKRIKLENSHVKGLLFALCCHHCCSWTSYVGRDFLQNLGFTSYYFYILCCLTSWATCGSRVAKETGDSSVTLDTEDPKERQESVGENHDCNSSEPTDNENVIYEESCIKALGLSKEESETLGRQCKRLLDAGRVSYLKEHGFEASLIYYVERSVSLENVALIAWKR